MWPSSIESHRKSEAVFYERPPDRALRFGDVVRGFVLSTPAIDRPIVGDGPSQYSLKIIVPEFCVVLSPCCSIGDGMLSLAPLKPVQGTFFRNPYFAPDLTRINRQMQPEQAVPPRTWEGLPVEEKERRLSEGFAYAFLYLFVYEGGETLPKYQVHRRDGPIETDYHMIDFRDTLKVKCKAVMNPKQSPLDAKLLQLSIQTRKELRDKMAHYYIRVPEEDAAQLALR